MNINHDILNRGDQVIIHKNDQKIFLYVERICDENILLGKVINKNKFDSRYLFGESIYIDKTQILNYYKIDNIINSLSNDPYMLRLIKNNKENIINIIFNNFFK